MICPMELGPFGWGICQRQRTLISASRLILLAGLELQLPSRQSAARCRTLAQYTVIQHAALSEGVEVRTSTTHQPWGSAIPLAGIVNCRPPASRLCPGGDLDTPLGVEAGNQPKRGTELVFQAGRRCSDDRACRASRRLKHASLFAAGV